MKLYWSDVLAPRKACAVAKYLDSPVDYVYLELGRGEHKTPEYLAMNPNGKVPTLVDGTRAIWEADAIMCHLAARCDSDLWPQDDRQIDVIRWLSWDLAHFFRAGGTLYFEQIVKPRFDLGDTDPSEVKQATEEWRRLAAILDEHLHDPAGSWATRSAWPISPSRSRCPTLNGRASRWTISRRSGAGTSG